MQQEYNNTTINMTLKKWAQILIWVGFLGICFEVVGVKSGFRIAPNWLQIGKMIMTSQFPTWRHRRFFWCRFFLLLSLVTGPSFISKSSRVLELWQFFFYKGLTRNSEIRNTPVWVWPNIWRLGPVRDTKFCKNVSNEMLLNAAKCQGYSFYGFWVIKGKPKGVGGKIKIPPQME